MGSKIYNWPGTTKWAKVQYPEKAFDKVFYCMDFYPKDDAVRKEVTKTLPRHKLYEDDDGFYFKLRAPEDHKPRVVDSDGDSFEGLIGNGSGVTVKVRVDNFKSKEHGPVVRAILKAVRIDELIEYIPDGASYDPDNDNKNDDDIDDDIPF